MQNKGNRIGILGGTFNPIHNGHLKLAEAARKAEQLDKILIMPSGHSYLKSHMQVLDGQKRYEMVKLAVSDIPYLSASDMEIMRAGNTYTYETLALLKKQYPDDIFYFIMGADNLFSIENWVKPEEIFANCIILVAVRNHMDDDCLKAKAEELKARFLADIRLLPFDAVAISSTQIRNCVLNGEPIDTLVPKKVASYIRKQHLYNI